MRLALVLAGIIGLSASTATSAPAALAPPAPAAAPTITGGPSGATAATTATFSYRHTQAGVTYQCALDNGSFRTCGSGGVTYSRVANGTHTFRVAARNGTSARGPVATRTWTVDRTPPVVTVAAPIDGATMNAASWGASCGTTAGICGSATDPADIGEVRVAVLQVATGRYWNGAAYAATTAQYLLATGGTSWTLPLPLPPDGRYQAFVRARDVPGNQTAGVGVRPSFAVDTNVPAAPVLTTSPEEVTIDEAAAFRFEGARADLTFECSLDGQPFRTCTSPQDYRSLARGEHCFAVRSRDGIGRTSATASRCWLIVVDDFPITGDIAEPFSPGVSHPVDLRITNPYPFPLRILEVTVTVRDATTVPACIGSINLVPLRQLGAQPVVPADTTATLSSLDVPEAAWPELTMPDLPVNQDACQDAAFTLVYTGRGAKA